MKIYTRDAVNEIYLMLNEPRAYAAQALQDMRDVMHVSVEEGPQFFSGFHQAAVQAKAELNRKRAETYRHESERLSIQEEFPPKPIGPRQDAYMKKIIASTRKDLRMWGCAFMVLFVALVISVVALTVWIGSFL